VAQLRGGIAPDLALSGADGAIRRLEELRGTPVLLHFWATWCPPCRQEMPALLQLARDLRREEGLELVAASVDSSWQSIDLFFDGKTPAQVYRVDGDAPRSFGVEELPDSYIVGRDGLLRARIEGARDWSSPAAREAVRAALARHEGDGNTE
jgi:thiol-disulfide isomerase/thioredoxin